MKINLYEVNADDVIVTRGMGSYGVTNWEESISDNPTWIMLELDGYMTESFRPNGRYTDEEENPMDIVNIIFKNIPVDISKINLGDTIVHRGGHSAKVFQLAYHEDLNVFEVNVQMYQPDGKVNKDYEHRVDIIKVIKGE